MAKRLSILSVITALLSWFLVFGGGLLVFVLVRPTPASPPPAGPPPALVQVEPVMTVAGYAAIALSVVAVVLGHLARRAGGRQVLGLLVGYVFLAAFVLGVLLPALAFRFIR